MAHLARTSQSIRFAKSIIPLITAVVGASLAASATRSALAAPPASAPRSWDFVEGGRWREDVAAPTTSSSVQPAADPQLVQIESLIGAGRYSDAEGRLVRWFRDNKGSPVKDRALFLMAEALYHYGDRIKSFYYLDELLDEYPDSRLFYPAVDKQYQIADSFLNGYKRRFLGMAILDTTDEGIDILYRIQQRSPGSPLAEKALLRTADWYYDDSQYDIAVDVYNAYIKNYPRSPEIPRARLRQAFANYAQFRGARFDATPLVDARAQMTSFIREYPDLAQEQHIAERVAEIDRKFSRKMLVTGDYYARTSSPEAAAYTYRNLIAAYPDSPDAQKAQQAMDKLPPAAVASTAGLTRSDPMVPPAWVTPVGPPAPAPRRLP